MFSKLKRNILVMNVVMITFLLVGSFASVYLLTWNNVMTEVGHDLRKASFSWETIRMKIESEDNEFNVGSLNEYLINSENYGFLESRIGRSYIVNLDKNKAITKVVGFYDSATDTVEELMSWVRFDGKESQTFKLENVNWAYLTRENEGKYTLVFLDITKRMGLLKNLTYTGLIIFMATMIFVVMMSLYMTNKSIKPLDVAYKRQQQFVSDASHELRTPLASINANIDLVISKTYIRPAERKWLDYIKREVLRMSGLTKDMLFLAELDEQTVDERHMEEVDLSYLANTHFLGMEAMAYEKKQKMESEIDEGIKVYGNSERLSQLFVILLENAMHYTPEEGKIKLELKSEKGIAELLVSNTGSYIPTEKLTRIFDRFYRGDESRGGKSTSHGLGLAIVKSIVERYGGSISCSSEPEGLTSFKVILKSF